MSITSNAKAKICKNSDKLLSMLDSIGVDVSKFEGVVPEYKKIVDNDKLCCKRWRQNNLEKCRAYWHKYIKSEKGQMYLEKVKERSKDPEYRAEKAKRQRALYKANKEKIDARRKELRELKKTPETMEIARKKSREYYSENRERLCLKRRQNYRKKKDSQKSDCSKYV